VSSGLMVVIQVTMTEKDKKKSIKDIEKKIKEPIPSRA